MDYHVQIIILTTVATLSTCTTSCKTWVVSLSASPIFCHALNLSCIKHPKDQIIF